MLKTRRDRYFWREVRHGTKIFLVKVVLCGFWICGVILTVVNMENNRRLYYQYPSRINQRESNPNYDPITFPVITVCMHSQHSRSKLTNPKYNYTSVTATVLQMFYGWSLPAGNNLREMEMIDWAELNKINISDFMLRTRSRYQMIHCDFQGVDCKQLWKWKRTFYGYCLQLDFFWYFMTRPKLQANERLT